MDSSAEVNQNIHIKTEKFDELECEADNGLETVDILAVVKKDESENDGVAFERYPWEPSSCDDTIPDSQKKSLPKHTPYEYDENPTIKAELEIDEPKLELEHRINKHNANKPAVQKRPKIARKRSGNQVKPHKPKLKTHHCQFCGKDFADKVGLERHSNAHPSELPYRCRVCMIRFSDRSEMKAHELNCKTQRYECYLCQYTSLHWRWYRFLDHFRKHTGEMPFNCKHCTKRFSSNRSLKYHMKYHPNEILVQSICSFCRRNFPSVAAVKKHAAQCAIQRKYECFLCKSTFTYRSSLLRHMPQHSGSYKFKCTKCSNAYARKDYLALHTQSCHAHQLQYHCSQCKQRFAQKSDLDAHSRTCTKLFRCDLCDYTTKSLGYAEDHKQKHIGNDEFKCLHCSAVFLQRSQLLKHLKTHNKKVPFSCPHCQRKYSYWVNLEKHRKKCSGPSNCDSNDDGSNGNN